MKKTQKNILGLFGLVAVVAITFFAAALPGPEASAVSSVTDTVTVRVISESPNITITGPGDGSSFVTPEQNITFDYEKADRVIVTVKYVDMDGVTQTKVLKDFATGQETGSDSVPINLSEFGYGEYTITVRGELAGGLYYDAVSEFSYLPLTATAEQDANDNNVDLKLNYDDNSHEIDKIVINVYDENGNLVEGLSPITVTPPTKDIDLGFADYGLADGKYIIEITAYNVNGDALYKPYTLLIDYKTDYDVVPVPDTGGLLQNTNISKTDYIITGIVVFSLVAIAGVMTILRNDKKNNKSSKRRRK